MAPMAPSPSPSPRLQALARFGLRALRISASTVSLVELLRSDWIGGAAAAAAWLLFVQVERRWSQADPAEPEP